jgi:hypothetical protein
MVVINCMWLVVGTPFISCYGVFVPVAYLSVQYVMYCFLSLSFVCWHFCLANHFGGLLCLHNACMAEPFQPAVSQH